MVREKRAKQEKELSKKLVSVARVSKVVKGGKRFNLSVLVVVGDGKGGIGYGKGKAKEVSDAMRKAGDVAARSMHRIALKEGRTVHQDVTASYGAGKVLIRSAPKGTGVIAGGAMRSVFEALGIQDVVAKVIGSSNPHNVVKATVKALKMTQSPRYVANKRDKRISDLFKSHSDNRQESGEALI